MHDLKPFPFDDTVPAPASVPDAPCIIPLGERGQFEAIVDVEDYAFLTQWKWNFKRSRGGNIYARRTQWSQVGKGKENARCETILMHRVVCTRAHGAAPTPLHEPDHKNRKPLDNRRENLKWVTRGDNERNKGRGQK